MCFSVVISVVYYFLSTQVTNDLISIGTPCENCFIVLNSYHMFNVELAHMFHLLTLSLEFHDVIDKLFAFNELFCDIVDRRAPIKKIKIRGRPLPYVTDEIRQLMKAREDWRKIARKTNDP